MSNHLTVTIILLFGFPPICDDPLGWIQEKNENKNKDKVVAALTLI